MTPRIAVTLDGRPFTNWLSLSVRRSMEELSASFEFEVADDWHETGRRLPFDETSSCAIQVGSETLLTGWVEDIDEDDGGDEEGTLVSGRDLLCDLVDCAAQFKGGQWSSATVDRIASDLIAAGGYQQLVVTADGVSLGDPISAFTLADGESVAEAIVRACRLRGLLLVGDGSGTLVFTRPGASTTATVLQRGVNVERSRRRRSSRERFSDYIVKSHSPATGIDRIFGVSAASHRAVAKDPAVKRPRPVMVLSDDTVQISTQRRADWQRNVRAGRAVRYRYTVEGWQTAENRLWQPNTLVGVIDDRYQLEDILLIIETEHSVSEDSGPITELEVCDPRALEVEVPPGRKKPRKRAEHNRVGKAAF
jgi:prophage tail gpP-like protein